MPVRAAAVAALTLFLLTACQARVEVALEVEQGGGDTVTVSVGLDDEVIEEVGDLGEVLDVDDLVERGWEIDGPEGGEDSLTWVRAHKPFADPAEATAVLDEVTGPDGPFGSLTLRRDRELVITRYELTGAVDLRDGIDAFVDEGLVEALGGAPLPVTAEELADATTFTFEATLPGEMRSNAPIPDIEPAVWELRLGEYRPVRAAGERFNRTTVLAGVIAAAAVLALVGLLTGRALRRSP